MRDGVKLFTQIYTPKNIKANRPAILVRTPYGLHPYGSSYSADIYPSFHFAKANYILVYQDIRGAFMSEGNFRTISPLLKPSEEGTDEASDSYDTVEWLLKHLKGFNGNVGVHGISFSGYLASVASVSGHPAIKAVSSQAPMANGFYGDDFRRNGALYLTHSAYYLFAMGRERGNPGKTFANKLKIDKKDSYSYYLNLGNIENITKEVFDFDCEWWNNIIAHESYDDYWKERSVNSYANRMHCPNLIVGGWYDAENLNGSLLTYKLTTKSDKNSANLLVMGPWFHGGWSSNHKFHDKMGTIDFGGASSFFEQNIEFPFFCKIP